MKREERREQSLECFAKKYDLDYEVTYTELIGDSPELRDEIHVYVASYMEEGESAVNDYKRFLSSGCSTDPISLLKIAGVDMSTPQPVNEALGLFGELIEEMEALI